MVSSGKNLHSLSKKLKSLKFIREELLVGSQNPKEETASVYQSTGPATSKSTAELLGNS